MQEKLRKYTVAHCFSYHCTATGYLPIESVMLDETFSPLFKILGRNQTWSLFGVDFPSLPPTQIRPIDNLFWRKKPIAYFVS